MKPLLFIILSCFTMFPGLTQPRVKNARIDGNGAPLVFLHGATSNMAGLDKPAKVLASDFKVIRMESFNAQYAALNKVLPEAYSVRMESDAIGATLDSLQISEPVILVGSSYGALIALDYAVYHPEKIKALVLLEPVAFSLPALVEEQSEALQKIRKVVSPMHATADITDEHVEAFRCLQINCDSVNIRTLPQWKGWLEQRNKLRGLSAPFDHDIDTQALRSFNKPVLIITGTLTTPLHKRINELLHSELRGSKLAYVESGHAIPITVPEQLAKMILDFVKD